MQLAFRGWKSPATWKERCTRMSSGSLWFNAKQILSAGIRLSVSNTATFPRACTPESVRLAPIMAMFSPRSALSVSFNTCSMVIPLGCTCQPR